MNLIINLIINAVIISILAYIIPGVTVDSFGSAMFAALVIGLIAAFIAPTLTALTLPINILTLGLFTFVIIALLVQLSDALVPGFSVTGFLPAIIFGVVLAIVGLPFGRSVETKV